MAGGRTHNYPEQRAARNSIREELGMDTAQFVETRHIATALDQEILDNTPPPSAFLEELEQFTGDKDEIIAACKFDLNFLAAFAMPTTFKFDFPSTHITAWQILIDGEGNKEQRFLQFAIGIPRGHAKTTLLKLFCLWCILFSSRRFILVICSIEQHAFNFIADVIGMLEESNVIGVFGDWRITASTNTVHLKKFFFQGRHISMNGIGSEGSVRGTNVDNERPDLMIMDDIQSKEIADSILKSKALIEWMVGTLMKSKSPHGCMFVYAGNMFAAQGSILRQLKTNKNWIKFISGSILADGTALWPELRSLEDLVQELENDISMGQAHIFFAEMLNDTEAGINSTVDYSRFPKWEWTKLDQPQGKYIVIDPSQGKGMDPDVIVLTEVYDGKIGVRSIVNDHFSPANLIRKALIVAIQNDVKLIAIEAMAYQSTLLYWFEYICKEHNIRGLQFVPIYTTTQSKNSRIMSGLKAMQTSEITLHPDVRPMVTNQIKDWNPMKQKNVDDILDAVSNTPKVLADYTYDIMTKSQLVVMESEGIHVNEEDYLF